jgi:DNA-binding NtrC family response regulator
MQEKKLSVIFADDNENIREVFMEYFSHLDAHTAETCEGLLKIYQEKMADVVVMDTLDRKDYKGTIEKIKGMNPSVRIVFASGMALDDLEAMRDKYKIAIKQKPFMLQDIEDMIMGKEKICHQI